MVQRITRKSPVIGVLALQGAVREHRLAIEKCGAAAVAVKYPNELEFIQGLIIPGGESTTISKLIGAYGLDEPIRQRAAAGMPIFGTCAGLILLGKDTVEAGPRPLGLMDIKARRNAFGRQVDSFETDLPVAGFGPDLVKAVFIRAPWIEEAGPGVKVLARHDGRIVLAEQGYYLACAFHPELTDDLRVHKYFLEKVKKSS